MSFMYIIKNALRCISRSKGRNVLIGIIVLVIAVSACLGLSIRQAAESARNDTLDTLTVTGTISFDRQSMMGQMGGRGEGGTPPEKPDGNGAGGFDREQFAEMMGGASALTLEEYKTYAAASTVKDFYYTLTASFDGSGDFAPVSTETDSATSGTAEEDTNAAPEMPGMGGGGGRFQMTMGASGDFQIVGYSGENAMTAFIDGTASVTDGEVFAEGTAVYNCLISEELATYNDLSVGDAITVANPNNEEEVYTLTVVGLYTDTSANQSSFSPFGTASDPANRIYMSHMALQLILDNSEKVSETVTDEDTGREYETAVTGTLDATYVFASTEDYETFAEEVYTLGLSESYTVSSADLTAFESSLTPLNTLSTMAGYFLIVILVIGALILIVLNIFNVRERKYEIGVLTAMGMKKSKVALQFLTEIFAVTLSAVLIGAVIGAVASVPVTNALLENQITSQQSQADRVEQNFGRPGGNMGSQAPAMPDDAGGGKGGMMNMFGDFRNQAVDYVAEIDSAMNLTVVWQMLGVAVLLTLAAGTVSMLFVMRYEPLKILANRD